MSADQKTDALRADMQVLTDFIIDAGHQVRSGNMVNLTGLDEKVARVCDRTLALPPAQATKMQPVMAEMIGHLEDLSNALRDYQDQRK
jgi:iron-sulfur cluster repair protein YtfE (RIC family)